MSNFMQDTNLETDHSVDFSLMDSRLDSFCGSSLAQKVPAERLARAGFYFTGSGDRVRCFSCQKTVENWHREDVPVVRHKEVSPSCRFLSCTHRTSFNPGSFGSLINGSVYDEEAEDMEYRLRTGEVVDESTYPMAPHMRSEEARLQTFSLCPSKHAKHFPNCFFILGHDVGNIPLQGATEEMEWASGQRGNTHVHMGSFEERLGSFTGVQHPIDHERLARAGFYSTGTGDKVLCFHCGGDLIGWQPEEDPWEEHARHYPGCSFLLTEKGQGFVNSIQLQDPRGNRPTSSHQNGFSGNRNEVLQSAMAQKAIGMGVEPSVV